MHLLFVHPGYFMRHLQVGVDTRGYIQNFRRMMYVQQNRRY
ncbi:hypothetical protein C1A50_1653 [Paenibacillus polymyxa]|nr:hypothetical protein C1A50_1653 [Paenibacillus polymyxa]